MAHKDAQAVLDSLVVFCPQCGWGAGVWSQPFPEYDGPPTPWHAVTGGGEARCGNCGRELVLGTFSACGECTLDEPLPGLPEDPSLERWEKRQAVAEAEYRAQVLHE